MHLVQKLDPWQTEGVKGYGQYCPIARGAEIFAERWSPIIVRNLLVGCETFNDILGGAPGLPRSLLSQRLRLLERQGVVDRRTVGRRVTYHLTDCGHELADVCYTLGVWGTRSLETAPSELDAYLALWYYSRLVDKIAALPARRIVVRFDLTDSSSQSRYWLLLSRDESEVCVLHPGQAENLIVTTDARWRRPVAHRRGQPGRRAQGRRDPHGRPGGPDPGVRHLGRTQPLCQCRTRDPRGARRAVS